LLAQKRLQTSLARAFFSFLECTVCLIHVVGCPLIVVRWLVGSKFNSFLQVESTATMVAIEPKNSQLNAYPNKTCEDINVTGTIQEIITLDDASLQ
jgi:hypothetical protein